MLRLQRYLLGELLSAFALVLLIVTGIFIAAMLLQTLQRYPDMSMLAVAELVPVLLIVVLPITMPMAFLVACLLSYGRFSDDNEFLAFQLGGLSPWHAIAPAVCAAFALSAGTLALNADVSPSLKSAMKSIVRGQIRDQVERMRQSTSTSVKLNDMEMSWDRRDGDWYRNVLLTWTSKAPESEGGGKKVNRVPADAAMVKLTDDAPLRLVITLQGVRIPGDDTSFGSKSTVLTYDVEQDPSRVDTKSKDEMRSSELYYRVARLEPQLDRGAKGDDKARKSDAWEQYRKYLGEYWRRVALGISPLAFALLGAPLGLIVRRGSRAQALVIALLVALPVYYPLLLLGDNLSRTDALPAAIALNLGNLLLAAVGGVMTLRLVTR